MSEGADVDDPFDHSHLPGIAGQIAEGKLLWAQVKEMRKLYEVERALLRAFSKEQLALVVLGALADHYERSGRPEGR